MILVQNKLNNGKDSPILINKVLIILKLAPIVDSSNSTSKFRCTLRFSSLNLKHDCVAALK